MSTKKKLTHFGLALLPVIALGACTVAPPSGPSVVAMPGQGKSFPQFQQDDANCRNYAQSNMGDTGQAAAAAQQNANTTAVAGTLIGAAAGAALGSLSGNVGAGLLGGASVAGNNTQAAADSLQRRYDVTYAQCMVGNGETIQQGPAPGGYGGPPPGYYPGPGPY
jgi:hypothetical protein